MSIKYLAYLHKDEDSDFGVSFPDFPGCVTAGRTLQEALAMAQEALAFHVEGMVADGEDIPVPSDLDALANDPSAQGAVVVLVEVDESTADPVDRVNITARKSEWRRIDEAATAAGLTRSAYIVRSALGSMLGPPEGTGRALKRGAFKKKRGHK